MNPCWRTPDAPADRIFLTGDGSGWPTAPGQRVRAHDDYLSRPQPRNPADPCATYLIVAVVTGYALLSAANTCALAQRDRNSERARLRAMGLSRPQLFRLVALETLAATAVGAVLAFFVSPVCHAPLVRQLGLGLRPVFNWSWLMGVTAATLVLTTGVSVCAAHPARRIGRQYAEASA
ncbi:FtsX-like permease family protein [Streptomyces sp. NPDC021100]|uniref:FtsX-like permease family protein n=1 Tax=Streptomyces sp. NPDC021100 TaxID=3365114 RepID=UPI00379685BC